MTRLRALLSPFTSLKTSSKLPQKLVEVPAGVRVRIRGFETMEGTETLRERGLCEEAEVRVLKAGDPLVCLVFGSRLILNRTIAEGILVEVLG
ncbi:MAG: ferrous iron transport protein A [Acidobacteria bacterium]|jgi:Fe2+ transport system protein FeoA|nr:ferrous iron transport protein A [Acidobacteriota bacterium]